MCSSRLRPSSMFTSTRPSSRRYQVAVDTGRPSRRRVAMTAGSSWPLGVRDSGTARASGERKPAGHPADQDGLVLNLGAGHRIDPEAAEQRYGVQRGDLRP